MSVYYVFVYNCLHEFLSLTELFLYRPCIQALLLPAFESLNYHAHLFPVSCVMLGNSFCWILLKIYEKVHYFLNITINIKYISVFKAFIRITFGKFCENLANFKYAIIEGTFFLPPTTAVVLKCSRFSTVFAVLCRTGHEICQNVGVFLQYHFELSVPNLTQSDGVTDP
jgi:hypothetical protein